VRRKKFFWLPVRDLGRTRYYANLDDADFFGADLGQADLTGAHLSKADLRNTDLSGIKWQEIAEIRLANVFGVKNAPSGFLAWAAKMGGRSPSSPMPGGSHDLTQTDLVFCLNDGLHSTPFLVKQIGRTSFYFCVWRETHYLRLSEQKRSRRQASSHDFWRALALDSGEAE
jgi:uncharacterized protein YjbI with pentapeptide repeats